MCSHTVARGSESMLPRKKNGNNGVIWSNLGVPKYDITNLKSQQL